MICRLVVYKRTTKTTTERGKGRGGGGGGGGGGADRRENVMYTATARLLRDWLQH